MTAHQLDTWSNAAYLGAAVYCGIVGAWAAMVLFTALAVASFGYHWWEGWDYGSNNRQLASNARRHGKTEYAFYLERLAKEVDVTVREWARADSAAMFALLLGIAVAAIVLLLALPIPWWAIPPTVLGLGAVLRYVVIPHTPIRTAHVTGVLGATAIVAVGVADLNAAAIGLGLLLVAVGVRKIPTYGHALWHLLAAAGTAVLAGAAA